MNHTKLKEIRLKKGYTQKELADVLGIDRSYLSQIETGRVNPSLSLLQKISDELGVKLKIFFS